MMATLGSFDVLTCNSLSNSFAVMGYKALHGVTLSYMALHIVYTYKIMILDPSSLI
jgi:hypothetical protein